MALVVGAGQGQQISPVSLPPLAKAPAAPKATKAAKVASPVAAPVAPLDATAIANIASYLNKTGGSITADQGKIDQLNQTDPIQQLKLMTAANAHGGLYGSAYGQQQGNLTAAQNYNIGQLKNAIAGLQASEPIYESEQAADSAAREAKLQSKLAPAATTTPKTVAGAVAPVGAQRVARAHGQFNARQLRQRGTPMGGFRE